MREFSIGSLVYVRGPNGRYRGTVIGTLANQFLVRYIVGREEVENYFPTWDLSHRRAFE